MTGFGAGAHALGAGRVCVELRAVNHRHVDLRLQLEAGLERHAAALEALCRGRVQRGRIDVRGRVEGSLGAAIELDRDRARAAFAALAELRDELAPGADLPLSLLGSVPDLFREGAAVDDAEVEAALTRAAERALDELDAMRVREGASLRAELLRLLDVIGAHTDQVRVRSAELPAERRARLRERLEPLLQDLDVDPGRIEQEIVLFADRCDTTEETARLDAHLAQARAFLEVEEPVGRRLDFLFQEMSREANTIGSKSPDAGIAQRVVELKAAIQQLRQQVANVE